VIAVATVCSLPISRSPWLWKAVCTSRLGAPDRPELTWPAVLEIFVAFLLLIVCLATAPGDPRPASAVFNTFANKTGWESKGYVYLLGWVSTVSPLR
jgi:hypothetical protein